MKTYFSVILTTVIALLICPFCNAATQPLQSSPAQVDGILSNAVNELVSQSDVYWHHGDYPRIIALDRIMTEIDPHYTDCYDTGGWLMDSLGRKSDAEAYYSLNIKNNPTTEDSYFSLAFFYFSSMHNYQKAAKYFKLACEQPDAGINDWKMQAHSYYQAKEYHRALAVWRQIAAKWPNGLVVQQNLKEAIADVQKEDAAKAGSSAAAGKSNEGAAAP